MWRRRLWFVAIVAACVAGITILAASRRASSPEADVVLGEPGEIQQSGINTNAPLAGTPLRHADVLNLDDTTVSTADWFLSDSRPMLVNFWFTTCPPCRREMPALEAAYETYGDEVRFVGVNVQDSTATIRSFVEELGVTYEMVRDPNGILVVSNGIAAFPTTLLIDSNGRIVKQLAGELTAEMIDQGITELLTPR